MDSQRQTIEINKLTSLHQDTEFQQYNTIQSMAPLHDHVLNNMKNIHPDNIDTATSQVMINFSDGHGLKPSNIKDEIRSGKVNNFRGDAQQLFPRPYLTIPYTGNGELNVDDHSYLRSANMASDNRQCNSLSGVYIDHQYIPLVKNLSDNIQNPDNLIQENAKEDWVRGGVDTTQIRKDFDYFERCIDKDQIRKVLFYKKPYLSTTDDNQSNLTSQTTLEMSEEEEEEESNMSGINENFTLLNDV